MRRVNLSTFQPCEHSPVCYEITRALETVYATAAARTPAAAQGGPRAGALETVYATAGALETVYATAAAPTKLKANV